VGGVGRNTRVCRKQRKRIACVGGNVNVNVMVFDVPAESGGALSVLHEFHAEVMGSQLDSVNWFFVLSSPKLCEGQNVKVLNYPWVKKSWLHRIYFDCFIAPQLIKQYSIDRIFSLQNVLVPRTSVPQVLYIHQPLPFVEFRFSFTESRLLWVYQNVIGRMMFRSMRMAEKVIVQTEWLRNEGAKIANIPREKIFVVRPAINSEYTTLYENIRRNSTTFFYPASAIVYKNHKIIIEACELLKQQGIDDYSVILTLRGDEDGHIRRLSEAVLENSLPVRFVGPLLRQEVFSYYAQSVLLFPSFIETFGLPMLEAALIGSPIIAADTPVAREVLDGYPNTHFFDCFDYRELALIMRKMVSGEFEYIYRAPSGFRNAKQTLVEHVLHK